jgi:hypothetical protein
MMNTASDNIRVIKREDDRIEKFRERLCAGRFRIYCVRRNQGNA